MLFCSFFFFLVFHYCYHCVFTVFCTASSFLPIFLFLHVLQINFLYQALSSCSYMSGILCYVNCSLLLYVYDYFYVYIYKVVLEKNVWMWSYNYFVRWVCVNLLFFYLSDLGSITEVMVVFLSMDFTWTHQNTSFLRDNSVINVIQTSVLQLESHHEMYICLANLKNMTNAEEWVGQSLLLDFCDLHESVIKCICCAYKQCWPNIDNQSSWTHAVKSKRMCAFVLMQDENRANKM